MENVQPKVGDEILAEGDRPFWIIHLHEETVEGQSQLWPYEVRSFCAGDLRSIDSSRYTDDFETLFVADIQPVA